MGRRRGACGGGRASGGTRAGRARCRTCHPARRRAAATCSRPRSSALCCASGRVRQGPAGPTRRRRPSAGPTNRRGSRRRMNPSRAPRAHPRWRWPGPRRNADPPAARCHERPQPDTTDRSGLILAGTGRCNGGGGLRPRRLPAACGPGKAVGFARRRLRDGACRRLDPGSRAGDGLRARERGGAVRRGALIAREPRSGAGFG